MGTRRRILEIDTLVLHCSATANGLRVTSEQIDEWHAYRGFRRDMSIAPHWERKLEHIGYHFVLYAEGAVRVGRPAYETGAHVQGHNLRSLGTCIVGTDKFTPEQWESLRIHVEALKKSHPHIKRVVGHRDLSPDVDGDGTVGPEEWLKICPGFDVAAWLAGGMVPLAGHVLGSNQ